jgi:hypothetical protein
VICGRTFTPDDSRTLVVQMKEPGLATSRQVTESSLCYPLLVDQLFVICETVLRCRPVYRAMSAREIGCLVRIRFRIIRRLMFRAVSLVAI